MAKRRGKTGKSQIDSTFLLAGLLALLLLDVAFLLAFPSGAVSQADLQLAETAKILSEAFPHSIRSVFEQGTLRELAEAASHVRALLGIRTLAFIFPVSVVYAIFGVGELSSLVFSLVSSLLVIFLLYSLSGLLANKRAGLLAGFLWVIHPANIHLASSPSLAVPYLAGLLGALLLFIIITKSERFAPRMAASVVLGVVVLLLSARPLLFAIFLLFGLFTWLRKNQALPYKWVLVAIGAAWALLLLANPAYAKSTIDLYQSLLVDPSAFFYLPLFLLIAPIALVKEYRGAQELLVLLLLTYALLPLESLFLPETSMIYEFTQSAGYLLLAIWMIMLVAVGAGEKTFLRRQERLLALIPFVSAFTFLLLAQRNFVGSQQSLTPTSTPMLLSAIAGGLVIILIFLFPAFVNDQKEKSKTLYLMLTLALFSIATISPTLSGHIIARSASDNTQPALHCLEKQSLALPLLVQDEDLLQRLNYLRGFEWKENGEAPIYQSYPKKLSAAQRDNVTTVRDAYVLVRENYALAVVFIPENWLRLGTFGVGGKNQMILFGVSSLQNSLQPAEVFELCNGSLAGEE